MSPAGLALLAAATFLSALAATRLVRGVARRRELLDHPNDRSAHATPTPRLGGIGIMVPFLVAGLLLVLWRPGADAGPVLLLLGTTAVISVLGLLDDLRPLPASWRFAVQLLAAAVAVLARGRAIGPALAPVDQLLPYPVLAVGAILWVVWATNLYNFMDGIDGLAGGQAVLASLGLAWAAQSLGDPLAAGLLLVLAAAAGGFLPYNLPKASIFMGDVGSTAIGFFLAAVPFASARPLPALAVVLALSLFVLDATTTLVRRVLRGERWHAPHRTHLYQRPLARGVGHWRITSVAWLGMAAVAGLAARYPAAGGAVRALMFLGAGLLFLAAWLAVRRLERGPPPTRAGG